MFVSHEHNTEQSHCANIANKSFESLTNLRYLRTILKNQGCMYQESTNRLNSRNSCNYLFQNLLPEYLIFKNIRTEGHISIVLHVFELVCNLFDHVKGRI
jgi:hypothetical protein